MLPQTEHKYSQCALIESIVFNWLKGCVGYAVNLLILTFSACILTSMIYHG